MTIRHIKIFKAICENNYNTTKAAKFLNMTQPAVSMAIKELENYYGVTLFDRIGRRLSITDAGEKLLEYSGRLTSVFDDMEYRLKYWDSHAPVRVGATLTPGGFLMPSLLNKFKEIYPETDINVSISTCYSLEDKLLGGEIDFAIVEGLLSSNILDQEPFADDRLCIVCNRESPYRNGQVLEPEEFKKLTFLTREKQCITRKHFDNATALAGFSVSPYIESSDTLALLNFALNGIGAAVLPYLNAKLHIDLGILKEIHCAGVDLNRKLYIVTNREKNLSASAKAFIDICKTYK